MGKQNSKLAIEERKVKFEDRKAQWEYEKTVEFAEKTIINDFSKTLATDNFCTTFEYFMRIKITRFRTMANKKQYVLDGFFDLMEKCPNRWLLVLLSRNTRMAREIEKARRIYFHKATKEEICQLVDKWFGIDKLKKMAAELAVDSSAILTNLIVSEQKGVAYLVSLGYKLNKACTGYLDKEKTISFRYEPARARKPKKDGSRTIKPARCPINYKPTEQIREQAKFNRFLNPSYQIYEANVRELMKTGVVGYEMRKMTAKLKKKYGELSVALLIII